jgi:hypothetical protein
MSIFEKFWNWLNGNKTTIGLVLQWLLAQAFFKEFIPDYTVFYQFLNWVSGLLLGTGIIHKFAKASTQPK